MLNLTRPLTWIDLEATGTDPETARIIQIGIKVWAPDDDGSPVVAHTDSTLVDPGISIPPRVTEITGISGNDVEGAPSFADCADGLVMWTKDSDLGGYNAISYDVPLLRAEFDRIGRKLLTPDDVEIIDPLRLEKAWVSRKLEAVHERYTGESVDNAHDALADVEATTRVFEAQLGAHTDGFVGVKDLAQTQRGDYLDDHRKLKRTGRGVVVDFGKHRGKTLSELKKSDPGYLRWMYREIDGLRSHIDQVLS